MKDNKRWYYYNSRKKNKMISAEQIYELVKIRGAVIPSDINSQLKIDTMLVGAILSDLIRSKRILISHAKIGGSPLYYIPEQKEKLERLYEYLNEKDKRTYDKLKSEKVLNNENLDPLTKTSLKILQDFAIPIKVNYKGKEILFWKWFLVKNEEVKPLIKTKLIEMFPEKKEENFEKENNSEKLEENNVVDESKQKESGNEEMKKTEKIITERFNNDDEKKETNNSNKLNQKKLITEEINENNEEKEIEDEFYNEIKEYFKSKNIIITSAEIIRKKSELDLIIHIPTPIGIVEYYCKAKSKKKSNEGDLASALLEAQIKRLPGIYISKGDFPKKIEDLINTKFKGIKILKI